MADTRYSDSDLKEFEELIHSKLEQARSDSTNCSAPSYEDDNRTEDTAPTFQMMEDGSDTMSREDAQLAARQKSSS